MTHPPKRRQRNSTLPERTTPMNRGKGMLSRSGPSRSGIPKKPRDSELARRSPVAKQNAKRKRKEFQRAYGGTERVEWTKAQSCVACRARQQIEVAHTVTGGMGRKANASTTVPLCSWCHAELHRVGRETFERTYWVNLSIEAEINERSWQRHLAAVAPKQREDR